MSESIGEVPQAAGSPQALDGPTAAPLAAAPIAGVPAGLGSGLGGLAVAGRKRGDFLYYGLRNKKLVFGLSLELLLVLS